MVIQNFADFQINCTQDGIKEYPLHKHDKFEIMIYLSGNGFMKTSDGNYEFSPGTIIIVPPEIYHGSSSENGFKNISIVGDFEQYLFFEKTVVSHDNESGEGRALAAILYNNRYFNNNYLSAVCTSFVYFVLQNLSIDDSINIEMNKIITEITQNFYDADIDLSELLRKSGYAENYIRTRFKEITGKTPKSFLRDVRIKHACYLIKIYANKISLSQICEQCGYTDYIYFSKKFKEAMGVSPTAYKNNFHTF